MLRLTSPTMHNCLFFTWKKIVAIIDATFAVAKRKPKKKKIRLLRDSSPWPLRYRCSALPIELTSRQGAGRWINSVVLNPWKDDDEVMNRWKSCIVGGIGNCLCTLAYKHQNWPRCSLEHCGQIQKVCQKIRPSGGKGGVILSKYHKMSLSSIKRNRKTWKQVNITY